MRHPHGTRVLVLICALVAGLLWCASALAASPANVTPPTASSGSAYVGGVIDGSPGTWDNAPTSYSYQWQRCDSAGANCADIAGASIRNYTVVSDDVGGTLRLGVTAVNADGSASAVSDVTGVVQSDGSELPANFSPPTIEGQPFAGEMLFAGLGEWHHDGATSYAYQWLRCDSDGSNCSSIAGAQSSTYTIGAPDLGYEIKLSVTATDAFGSASADSDGLPIDPNPQPLVWPHLLGSATVGSTMTVTDGIWAPTPDGYTYTWFSCTPDLASCQVVGTAASSYLVTSSDSGQVIEAEVQAAFATHSDAVMTYASDAVSSSLPSAAPVNTSLPGALYWDSVRAYPGLFLSSVGVWTDSPTSYTYQWVRCTSSSDNSSCSSISGATDPEYYLTQDDIDFLAANYYGALKEEVTASNAIGSTTVYSYPYLIALPAPVNVSLPQISGLAQTDHLLTADAGQWTYDPQPLWYIYQWERCDSQGEHCQDIAGATTARYTPSDLDLGHTLVVRVTVNNYFDVPGVDAESQPTAPIVENPGPHLLSPPTVAGTAQTDDTVTADPGQWQSDESPTYSYSWQVCWTLGDPTSCFQLYVNLGTAAAPDWEPATSSSLVVPESALGGYLEVAVTATTSAGWTTVDSADYGPVVAGPPPSNTSLPTISGDLLLDGTLNGSPGSWDYAPSSFAYQWWRCDATGSNCAAISGATAEDYTLTAADNGHTLLLGVGAHNDNGSTAVVSAATGVFSVDAPANTDQPTIVGTVEEGTTVDSTIGSWDAEGTTHYSSQWQLCDLGDVDGTTCSDIVGATATTYAVTTADYGHQLRLKVEGCNEIGCNDAYSALSVVSPATPTNTALPTISGTTQELQTLTADPGTWQGSNLSFSYQWQRCDSAGANCTDISGAQDYQYVPQRADVDSTIRAAITATNETASTTAVSDATDTVAGVSPFVLSSPTVTGDLTPDSTLSTSSGSWSNSPDSYAYQWQRCDPVDDSCSDIAGAASATYTVMEADTGFELVVQVTATNAYGSGVATSGLGSAVPLDQPSSLTLSPSSPGHSLAPALSGDSSPEATINVFASTDCSGAAAASGTSADFTSGITVTATANSASTYSVQASKNGVVSPCSEPASYLEDGAAPPTPSALLVTPMGPANNDTPTVSGTAETGSAVAIYDTADCSGTPLATGTAAVFAAGITTTVPDNAATTFYVTATDAAGNVSDCSSGVTYTEGLVSGTVVSAANDNNVINVSALWTHAGSPYIVYDDVTIACGATLTIEPGVVVKLGDVPGTPPTDHTHSLRSIHACGPIHAEGTSQDPVVFTSVEDDAYNGDATGDGLTAVAPEQWGSIFLSGGASEFTHTVVRGGGYTQDYPVTLATLQVSGSETTVSIDGSTFAYDSNPIRAVDSSVTVTDQSKIDDNSGTGIHLIDSYLDLEHSEVLRNQAQGVNFDLDTYDGKASQLLYDTVSGNDADGVVIGGPATALGPNSWPHGNYNSIYGNGDGVNYAQLGVVTSSDPPSNLDWRYNYWGSNFRYFSNPDQADCGILSGAYRYYNTSNANDFSDINGVAPITNYPPRVNESPLYQCLYPKVDVGRDLFGRPVGDHPVPGPLADPNASGSFVKSTTDISLPGVGVPFSFTRTYSSIDDTKDRPMGFGWSDNLSVHLQKMNDGSFYFKGAGGADTKFSPRDDGGWQADPGVAATLQNVADGGYYLTEPDGTRYYFNDGGQLVTLEDRNDQGLHFLYLDGETVINDATNEEVATLTYNANGQLATITTRDGRSVGYGYDSEGRLHTVRDVRGYTWTYTYDDQGRLSLETDPLTHTVFRNVYNDDNRLTDQYDGLNHHTKHTWDSVTASVVTTDAALHDWTEVYDENNRISQTKSPLGAITNYSYGYGNDGSMTVTTSDGMGTSTVSYDKNGNMTDRTTPVSSEHWAYNLTDDAKNNTISSYKDSNNYTTTYQYDDNGNLTEKMVDGQFETTFIRYPNGLLHTTTNQYGDTWTYDYYGDGTLQFKISPKNSETTSYTYWSDGFLKTTTSPRGNVSNCDATCKEAYTSHFTYDEAGNKSDQIDQRDNETSYIYDEVGNLKTVNAPMGATWAYEYNEDNQPTRETAPGETTPTLTCYTDLGEVLASIDPMGRKTSYGYDEDGRQTSRVDPKGNTNDSKTDCSVDNEADNDSAAYTWQFHYDAHGNQDRATNPLNKTWLKTYDFLNRPTVVTDPLTHSTTYGYDGDGNQTSVEDASVHAQAWKFDALNRLTLYTDGRGKQTHYDYSLTVPETTITDARGDKTVEDYNPDGQLWTVADPRGFDTNGNPTADQGDHLTIYDYDADGNLTSVANPLATSGPHNPPVAYEYSPTEQLTSTTDANGNKTQWEYDALGRLHKVKDADLNETTYDYDARGNLSTRLDAKLRPTTYGYNDDGQLISITKPLNKEWTFHYDDNGNLDWTVDANANAASDPALGKTAYVYDTANQLHTVDYSDSAVSPDVTYDYYDDGSRQSMTDSSGTTGYDYFPNGQLQSVSKGGQQFSYTYTDNGDVATRSYPSRPAISYGYDDAENLQTITANARTTTYGHDHADNLDSITSPDGVATTIYYDNANQLSEVKAVKGTTLEDFQYLRYPNGNVKQLTTPTGVENYTYDDLNRLTAVCYQALCPTATDYTKWEYDEVGNRKSETTPAGTTTYSYNDLDWLTQTSGPSGTVSYGYDANGNQTWSGANAYSYNVAGELTSATVNGKTSAYGYDGDGNRVSATTSGATTDYLWDVNAPLPQLAEETTTAGSLIRGYVGDGQQTLSMTSGGTDYTYHYDGVGNVAQLTNSAGTPQWTYSYTPFGQAQSTTKNYANAPANPLRFAGQYQDTTGLYNLRAREYDSQTGRFLATDPIAAQLTDPYVSAYVYGNDNPLLYMDPSGQSIAGIVKGATHLTLNILSFIPVIGTPAALLNCGLYAAEGDAVNAGLSCAQAIPFVGDAVGVLRAARAADETLTGLREIEALSSESKLISEADAGVSAAKGGAASANTADTVSRTAGAAAEDGAAPVDDPALSCALNSFAKGTEVLLDSGRHEPIEKIKVGDKVLATDPATGETVAEPVTALIRHTHRSQLVRVTVGGRSLVATGHHPFWAVNRARWVYADQLHPGDLLREPNGAAVRIAKVHVFYQGGTWFNLTIGSIHTYYVEVGQAPRGSGAVWVLVHNSCVSIKKYTGPGGGHHIFMQSVLRDAIGYDSKEAFAIPNSELDRLGIMHENITSAQRALYKVYELGSGPLDLDAIQAIERQALIDAGMEEDMASYVTSVARKQLDDMSVSGPLRYPWPRP